MKMIFVRHGQDDDRFRGGWSPLGLLEEGKRQSQAVAQYLKAFPCPITKLVSSDLPRAMETAAFLSESLHLPIQTEPQLRETNNGDLAGMDNAEALKKYPGLFFSTLGMEEPYPNGESPADFYRRIKAWFENVLKTTEDTTLVVTHGGVINIVYHLVKNQEWSNRKKGFPVGKCSIHVLDPDAMAFETENLIVW